MPTPQEKTSAINAPVLFRLRELQASVPQPAVATAVGENRAATDVPNPLATSHAIDAFAGTRGDFPITAAAAPVTSGPCASDPCASGLPPVAATENASTAAAALPTVQPDEESFFERWRVELKNSVILVVAVALLWGAWLLGHQAQKRADANAGPAAVADASIDRWEVSGAVAPQAAADQLASAAVTDDADASQADTNAFASDPVDSEADVTNLAATDFDGSESQVTAATLVEPEAQAAQIVEPTPALPSAENITQEPQVAAVVEPAGDAPTDAIAASSLQAPPIGVADPQTGPFVGGQDTGGQSMGGQESYYGEADFATLPQSPAEAATTPTSPADVTVATQFVPTSTPGSPNFNPQQAVTPAAAALSPGHQYSSTPNGVINWALYFPSQEDGAVRAAATNLPGAAPVGQAPSGDNSGVAPIYR